MVLNNTILLSLEGWSKYIEGFIKGIQSSESVSAQLVMDCIGEVIEFMNSFKPQLMDLFLTCEKIMAENEALKEELTSAKKEINTLRLSMED